MAGMKTLLSVLWTSRKSMTFLAVFSCRMRTRSRSAGWNGSILTLTQFRRLTRPQSRDTTIWSRFSQPVRLVWVRDSGAADSLLRCVVRAVGTAARWAAELGPEHGRPEQYWEALFRRTYAAELRVEKTGRSRSLIDHAERA